MDVDKHKVWLIVGISVAVILIAFLFIYPNVEKGLVGEATFLPEELNALVGNINDDNLCAKRAIEAGATSVYSSAQDYSCLGTYGGIPIMQDFNGYIYYGDIGEGMLLGRLNWKSFCGLYAIGNSAWTNLGSEYYPNNVEEAKSCIDFNYETYSENTELLFNLLDITDFVPESVDCIDFNAYSDYITLGNSHGQSTEDFSVSVWIKTETTAVGATWAPHIIGDHDHTNWGGWALGIGSVEGPGKIQFKASQSFTYGDKNNYLWDVSTDLAYNDNEWHHLVAIRDATDFDTGIKIYVDNVLVSTGIQVAGDISNVYDLTLGADHGGTDNLYIGSIYDPQVFDALLTPEQIGQLFDNGPSGESCGFCVPNCDGKECGDDGCGGECGTCKDSVCNENGICEVSLYGDDDGNGCLTLIEYTVFKAKYKVNYDDIKNLVNPTEYTIYKAKYKSGNIPKCS